MTSQFDFTNDQWDVVASAPLVVGMAVAKAEDSGFFGSIRETRTLLSTITSPERDGPARSLIEQAATIDVDARYDDLKARTPEELAFSAAELCQELVAVLDAVADTDEAAGYKAWVLSVAREVAGAAKEDGVRVSPGEEVLVDKLAAILGTS